jgi:hypothetical protein
LFIGLVSLFFKHINQKVPFSSEDSQQVWTEKFGTYIRHNDIALMEACRKVLKEFEEDLMVCEDWMEMFDVLGKNFKHWYQFWICFKLLKLICFLKGYLEDITEPTEFLKAYLTTFSK